MLEVSSVHVPKTAGTSFIEVLRAWFGPGLALEYHCNGTLDEISPWTRAIHGHFRATDHEARKLITWMREPARRMASHYFYWKVTQPVARVDPLHLEVLAGNVSLLEFAAHPDICNLHAWYFNGLAIDDFAFVGIAENISPEMGRLARTIGQPPIAAPRMNTTSSDEYRAFKASADYDKVMDEIRALNALDCELYAAAQDRMQAWWSSFAA